MNISISGIHFHPHFRVSHMLIVLKIEMPSDAASQFVHNFDFLTVSIQKGAMFFRPLKASIIRVCQASRTVSGLTTGTRLTRAGMRYLV